MQKRRKVTEKGPARAFLINSFHSFVLYNYHSCYEYFRLNIELREDEFGVKFCQNSGIAPRQQSAERTCARISHPAREYPV